MTRLTTTAGALVAPTTGRTLGFISLIHLNADGGDGGILATASTLSRATSGDGAMRRWP